MDSEHKIIGSSQPEENLHELLEAAELRKITEIKQTSKSFSLIVGIPIIALLAWGAIFLLTYEQGPVKKPEATTPPVTTNQLTSDQKDDAKYDTFRDEKDRVVKTNALGLKETSGKLVDKEDIHFAMELLNFMKAPENEKHDK